MKKDRRPRERLLDDADVLRLKSMYEYGHSVRECAELVGIGSTLAWQILSGWHYDGKGKVQMRTKGGKAA